MNHEQPGQRKPPRAEPIQPDLPGRGLQKERTADRETDDAGQAAESAENLRRQSEDALDNVREGYGKR